MFKLAQYFIADLGAGSGTAPAPEQKIACHTMILDIVQKNVSVAIAKFSYCCIFTL
ncbi:hypothetical protein [Cesiribacter sp. SM1]|uniref:hypothetical protein n=1 Tax=Cesiribacter sp. SM1 TaxID=2861196 RepID=UPI001CD25AA2|nr:hypothetical protein [Cesiribacter sp. SM1]